MELRNAEHDAKAIRVGLMLVVAIGIALLVLLGVHQLHKHNRSVERTRLADVTAATTAQIKVPAGYVRYTEGCQALACYRVDRPSADVVTDLPAILRSTGAKPVTGQPRCARGQLPAGVALCSVRGVLNHQQVIVFSGPPGPTRTASSKAALRAAYLTTSEVGLEVSGDSKDLATD